MALSLHQRVYEVIRGDSLSSGEQRTFGGCLGCPNKAGVTETACFLGNVGPFDGRRIQQGETPVQDLGYKFYIWQVILYDLIKSTKQRRVKQLRMIGSRYNQARR